ncbi:23S rRNA (adenine(2503)-C(2))-methyltransferase RlmN [Myxococcota bacterium]|nr:23S rRNA (adenine(2503)-C(2))-methyltransferase RlmN [Myxococcota bacterium]
MTETRPGLLGLEPAELVTRLDGPGRARAVYAELRAGRDPFTSPGLMPGARARLARVASDDALAGNAVHRSADGTTKLLLGLRDGLAVEAVLIPEPSRTTLCVSSQVGCARGCTFCLTATMKLVRSLSAAEITAQVAAGLSVARELALPGLRNVVFMGMGEPLDNADAVRASLAVITGSGLGLGVGPGHVTVSTVGPSPSAIEGAADLPAHLAWSLHAADDTLRSALVPTARARVTELRDAFARALARRGKKEPLFVEVTLLDGINDRDEDARAVAELFAGFGHEVRLNLLPMNPIDPSVLGPGARAQRPSPPERVEAFERHLRAAGFFTKVRRARGTEERAACGQLAVEARRLRVAR